MKYRVRLLEKRFQERIGLQALGNYISSKENMVKLLANPALIRDNVLMKSTQDPDSVLAIQKAEDVLLALSKAGFLPDMWRTLINKYTREGTKDTEPTRDFHKSIELVFTNYPNLLKVCNLFVPDAEGSAKDPETVQKAMNKYNNRNDLTNKDIIDIA
jgi:hypothetical protein